MTQVFSIFSNIILPILFILTTGYVLQKLIKFDPAVFTKVIAANAALSDDLCCCSCIGNERLSHSCLATPLGIHREDLLCPCPCCTHYSRGQLARIRLNYRLFDVMISAVLRLLVAPLIALLLLRLFHFGGIAAKTLLISTSMPTAVNTALIALEFRNEPHFASQAVLFSTLLSIATVSFSIYGAAVLFS